MEEKKSCDRKSVKAVHTSSSSHDATNTSDEDSTVNILSLNEDVFQEILSYLSFDEIAKLRGVCRRFNETCQKVLNKGFQAVQRYHSKCLKEMKAKLPRRESERRTHPLARHIDVLTGIETRLSLLSMTYYKYTVLGVFCFIPGKVLDECYRILREVVLHKNPPKSYELLQELRDISSMAMEHFEEHIVPTMKKNQIIGTGLRNNAPRFMRCLTDPEDVESDSVSLASSTFTAQQMSPIRTLNGLVRNVNSSISGGASCSATNSPSSTSSFDFIVHQNRAMINLQRKHITELRAKLQEYNRKMTEQDRLLNEWGRKLNELEQKVNSREAEVRVQPATVLTVDTPPPSTRKRPAANVCSDDSNEANQPVVKRKVIAEKKEKKLANTFSMSLRKRKSSD